MKFQAEKPDLTLELTTLSEEEVVLNPTAVVSAKEAIKIAKKWDKNSEKYEEDIEAKKEKEEKEEKEEGITPMDLVALQISVVYPKSPEWFLKNIDCKTLNDILIYVVKTIFKIKKNITESKESQD